MTILIDENHLRALLEIKEGCFHAYQCQRASDHLSRPDHADMSRAFSECLKHELVSFVGDEAMLTNHGEAIVEDALIAAHRYVNLHLMGSNAGTA